MAVPTPQNANDAEPTQLALQTPYGSAFNLPLPFDATKKEDVLAKWASVTGSEAIAKLVAENSPNIHLFTSQGVKLEGATTLQQLFERGPPGASPVLHLRVSFHGGVGASKRCANVAADPNSRPKKQATLFAFKFSNDQVTERGPHHGLRARRGVGVEWRLPCTG